jgi:hypothetical protein
MSDSNETFGANATAVPCNPLGAYKLGDHEGDRAQKDIVPFQLTIIDLHELVTGSIADKRRLAIAPERMGRALMAYNRAIGEAILETKTYTVLMMTVTLDQAKEVENLVFQQPTLGMSMGMPPGRAGGYIGAQQLQFAVFSDLTQPGVHISLHPYVCQGLGGVGEGAMINIALGLLLGEDQNIGLGFGK